MHKYTNFGVKFWENCGVILWQVQGSVQWVFAIDDVTISDVNKQIISSHIHIQFAYIDAM